MALFVGGPPVTHQRPRVFDNPIRAFWSSDTSPGHRRVERFAFASNGFRLSLQTDVQSRLATRPSRDLPILARMAPPAPQRLPADVVAALTEVLDQARDANKQRSPARRCLRMMVHHLAGLGWRGSTIAAGLGVSRQYVDQLRRGVTQCWWPPDRTPPRPPPVWLKAPRVTTNPWSHVSLAVPDKEARRLRRMVKFSRTVNGTTPADDPRRKVGLRLAKAYADLLKRGYSPNAVARAAGVSRGAVEQRLVRYRLNAGKFEYPSLIPRPQDDQRAVSDALADLWGLSAGHRHVLADQQGGAGVDLTDTGLGDAEDVPDLAQGEALAEVQRDDDLLSLR